MKKIFQKTSTLVTLLVIISSCLLGGVYFYVKMRDISELNNEEYTYEEREIMDVQPLLNYARAIMGGQVLEKDEKNRLSAYNFNKEDFPEVVSFYVDLKLVDVKHDFHTGYIDIIYTKKYFDETGRCVSYSIDIPARWEIEKRHERWYVIKRYEDI